MCPAANDAPGRGWSWLAYPLLSHLRTTDVPSNNAPQEQQAPSLTLTHALMRQESGSDSRLKRQEPDSHRMRSLRGDQDLDNRLF
jgi:hypothetical protein